MTVTPRNDELIRRDPEFRVWWIISQKAAENITYNEIAAAVGITYAKARAAVDYLISSGEIEIKRRKASGTEYRLCKTDDWRQGYDEL